MGHDGQYSSTTYGRKIYDFVDARVGHNFVDVLAEMEDGRFSIDFSKFHDTAPVKG